MIPEIPQTLKDEAQYQQLVNERLRRIDALISELSKKISSADAGSSAVWSRRPALPKISRPAPPPTTPTPAAPTGVTLVIADYGESFGLSCSWTMPEDRQVTVGYELVARYWTDAACTMPESDVIYLTPVLGVDVESAEAGPWPRPDADRWAKIAVRGIGADNAVGNWVWSAAQKVAGGGTINPPTDPVSGDWSLPTPSNGAGDYGADANGQQFVRLRPSVVNMPAGAAFMEFWLYKGASRPANLGLWEYIGSSTTPGPTESWQAQPRNAETWVVCATTSGESFRQLPTPTSDMKSVSITAWKDAPALTSPSVTAVNDGIREGLKKGHFTLNATVDTADNNFHHVRVERRWCSPGFTAPYSDWFEVFGPTQLPWGQNVAAWDWPASEYTEWRFGSVNHAGDVNWCATIVQVYLSGGGTLTNAPFTMTGSNIEVTIDPTQSILSSYWAVASRDTVNGNRAVMGTRNFMIYNAYGYPVASLFAGTPYDAGYLQLWSAFGTEGVYIDGANGIVRGNAGFATKSGSSIVNGITALRTPIIALSFSSSGSWVPSDLSGSEDLAGVISKVNALLSALRNQALLYNPSISYSYTTVTGGIITSWT